MKRELTDIGASVRQRLYNRSLNDGKPLQELLQDYAMERFLYRLSRSQYRHILVLKGGLLFAVWEINERRATIDIDLLGLRPHSLESIRNIIIDLCTTQIEPKDGIVYHAESLRVESILVADAYPGVRAKFMATLSNARVRMQIDIGFGDSVIPKPIEHRFPTLLDHPAPQLLVYPMETMLAEKIEIMASRKQRNSRIKDYYDVWLLSRHAPFDVSTLLDALDATLTNRGTDIDQTVHGLSGLFATHSGRQRQWKLYRAKQRLNRSPESLPSLVDEVAEFARPLMEAIRDKQPFTGIWLPCGPWKT